VYVRAVPLVEAAHLRAAASHDRAALLHEQTAALYDGMGLSSLAREERARARLYREGADTELEYARKRHKQLASQRS
jgi:lipoprotein NlpI